MNQVKYLIVVLVLLLPASASAAYECEDGEVIEDGDASYECDGYPDCADGSDEAGSNASIEDPTKLWSNNCKATEKSCDGKTYYGGYG